MQSTFAIANVVGAAFRAAINNALQAMAGQNSGATAPTELYPYMLWADSTGLRLRMRNAANTAWIDLYDLTSGAPINGLALAGGNLTGPMTMTGAAINEARSTVAATATTTPLWAAGNGNIQDWTGTPTITNFPAAPQAGTNRVVYPTAGTVLTSNANISVQGGTNYTTAAGDCLEIMAVTVSTFRVSITKADGSAITDRIGFKNRFINGAMAVDQRNNGAAQTITAGAALAYTVDRFYSYCTGANVTGQRVAGTAPNKYNYQFTGAASVTKIGHAQRIEAINSQDLAGTTATLSVDLANSLLTTVTWTAWYANTADTFGTLASPTRTQIATGTFTVNSTLSRYAANIPIPAAATTGIEVEFSVGAQTSGSWTIGRAQLEPGPVATPFEYRPYTAELSLCQRYLPAFSGNSLMWPGKAKDLSNCIGFIKFPITTRVPPTSISVSSVAHFAVDNPNATTSTAFSGVSLASASTDQASIAITNATNNGNSSGGAIQVFSNNAAAQLLFNGCEL
jgi:hypothetical protein